MSSSEGIFILSPEILEHILQFSDGETLLMCHNVSPEFSAAVKYLSKKTHIWKNRYFREKDKYPFGIIGKFYPHDQAFRHKKNWGIMYELNSYDYASLFKNRPLSFNEIRLGKDYSQILDVQTHGDMILVLMKYSRDFSKYCRIFTLSLDNCIIGKSCTFFADMLYLTGLDNPSSGRRDAIALSCDFCHLVAVPLSDNERLDGYPKFSKSNGYLKVEYDNGDVLWLNGTRGLTTKENCFCVSDDLSPEQVRMIDKQSVRISQGFTTLFLTYNETQREFNTFRDLRATVSSALHYSSLLLLGTNTGMLYAYKLANETDMKELDLKKHILKYDVCSSSILRLTAMELLQQLIIICCSEKTLYKIHFKRKLCNDF